MNDVQDIQDLRSCIVWDGFLNVFHYPVLRLKPELLAVCITYPLPDKQMYDSYTLKLNSVGTDLTMYFYTVTPQQSDDIW